MKRLKNFLNRIAETNKKQFGPGRLNLYKMNYQLWNDNLPSPHECFVKSEYLELPSHEPITEIYEAMKLADVIFQPKFKTCIIVSPYQVNNA